MCGEGRSQGSEPHLAQGCQTFVFIGADRAAPLAALLSRLSLGGTPTPCNSAEKSPRSQTRGGLKRTAVTARCRDWQLREEYCTLTASGSGNPDLGWFSQDHWEQRGNEGSGSSREPVNQPTTPPRRWKDRDPRSDVSSEKKEKGRFSEAKCEVRLFKSVTA